MNERTNPQVDYGRLRQLSDEFTELWKRLQAFYLDASAGFFLVHARVQTEQAHARLYVSGTELDSEEFQDTRSFSYDQIFTEAFCTSAIHQATQGEVKARNTPDGTNFATLGQVCVVSFYDFWNDYLRREYAIAKGHLDPKEADKEVIEAALRQYASHDLWGDIRLLRQSIVHHRGIATDEIAKAKLIKWYKPGDRISIAPDRMRGIFLALLKYRNDLFSEQFPKQHILIPKI